MINKQNISKEMHHIYFERTCETTNKAHSLGDPGEPGREKLMKISQKITDICTLLKKTQSKQNIMREACELFYDKDFMAKLDRNPYLLCFNNGVIDFKQKVFRKGQPDDFLSKCTGIDYVPHMINLPELNDDLRNELNIPEDATVFGRNGGHETFDLPFVKNVIRDIIDKKGDYYFIFQNTEIFINHPRVIFLEKSPDMDFKTKFINTCDAHLHARIVGESFGLTCGEFSIRNKPVITWNGSVERNHIDILGDKALLYNNYDDLMNLLLTFDKNKFNDWNCYREYLPNPVMDKFKKLYDI
jgi:hypothetical protein